MAFMGTCVAKDGLDVQQQARGSQQLGALKRSLSSILEETEGGGFIPSLSAEGIALTACCRVCSCPKI